MEIWYRFSKENIENAGFVSKFKSEKKGVFLLHDILQIPDQITCSNREIDSGVEALRLCLKKYNYLCWYGDMIPRLGRPVRELIKTILNNYTQNLIDER